MEIDKATEAEIAWLAGILDSEGCFDFNGRSGRAIRIRVEMKDRDVIERVRSLCGGNEVRTAVRANPNHNDTYRWQVSEKERTRSILKAIYPWMSDRRKAKIDILLAI